MSVSWKMFDSSIQNQRMHSVQYSMMKRLSSHSVVEPEKVTCILNVSTRIYLFFSHLWQYDGSCYYSATAFVYFKQVSTNQLKLAGMWQLDLFRLLLRLHKIYKIDIRNCKMTIRKNGCQFYYCGFHGLVYVYVCMYMRQVRIIGL